MAGNLARYVLDTSSWVAAWAEHYPIQNFPKLWERFGEALDSGIILIPEEVLRESERRDDSLYKWLKAQSDAVQKPDAAIYDAVKKLMGHFPRLVDTRTGKSGGDPWVIACALCHQPKLTLVTEEKGGTENKPKIPSICADSRYNIPCMNVLGLIQAEKWVF